MQAWDTITLPAVV